MDYLATFSDLSVVIATNSGVETAVDPSVSEVVAVEGDSLAEVAQAVSEAADSSDQ